MHLDWPYQRRFKSIKGYYGEDEKKLLNDFNTDVLAFENNIGANNLKLVGWSNAAFDCPMIWRRSLIHQINYCSIIDTSDLKPWLTPFIDLKILWKGGSYSWSSLIAAAVSLGVESPKQDISGQDVTRVFWEDGDVERIAAYCSRDVETTANIFRRLRFEPLLKVKYENPEIKAHPLITRLINGAGLGEKERVLLKQIKDNPEIDNKKAKVILNAITSTARGQETKIKKSDVTKIFK